jgi:hypothetical protein
MPEPKNFKLFEGACARVFEILAKALAESQKRSGAKKSAPARRASFLQGTTFFAGAVNTVAAV